MESVTLLSESSKSWCIWWTYEVSKIPRAMMTHTRGEGGVPHLILEGTTTPVEEMEDCTMLMKTKKIINRQEV